MKKLLQIDFAMEAPFGAQMSEAFEPLAQSIAQEKGLIWKIWTDMEAAMREYWLTRGFTQIYSPKFVAGATESGAELFSLDYFLNIWLPLKNLESIHRATYYNWLKSENQTKQKTIKQIDDLFKSLAIDIVANEGKGIFYAKNRLSMTDKQQLDGNINFKADFGTD